MNKADMEEALRTIAVAARQTAGKCENDEIYNAFMGFAEQLTALYLAADDDT
jgi:hypothetical protein